MVRDFEAKPEAVTINFFDMPRENVAKAGTLFIDQ